MDINISENKFILKLFLLVFIMSSVSFMYNFWKKNKYVEFFVLGWALIIRIKYKLL